MEHPATPANDNATPITETPEKTIKEDSAIKTGSFAQASVSPEEPTAQEHTPTKGSSRIYSEKSIKQFSLISWASVVMAFLPLIILVAVADGYDSIERFSATESLYFPLVMFAVCYLGSRYARVANNNITKAFNALFGTFYIFLLMLYFASGVIGLNAVLIIPLMLPIVLPVVFLWLMGIKVTLSKLRKQPLDKDGNPVDGYDLDPMKETLPDKTFAAIVFQIIGVFLAISLGYFVTVGVLALL